MKVEDTRVSWLRIGPDCRPFTEAQRSVVTAAMLLIALQALDGILTFIGVSKYGVQVEGNPILRSMMLDYGVFSTIYITKILAVFTVTWLVSISYRVLWIREAIAAMSVIYCIAAIAPWSYLLFIRPLIL